MSDSVNGTDVDSIDVSLAMQQRLDESWAALQEARRSLSEVMSDDELRELGINVEVLDEEP